MAIKKETSVAVRKSNTSIATIDSELDAEIAALKDQISQPTGNKIKLEPSGNFILPDGTNLGNQIDIVVVDFVSTNKLYLGAYNPNVIVPPDCFAIGKNINEMIPDELSPSLMADSCRVCPQNVFGSAANGKSKACKNTRELAVLLVNAEDPDAPADSTLYVLSIPPTSLRNFDGAVANVARVLGGPPIKSIMTVTTQPMGTYAVMSFVDPIPNKHYAEHAELRALSADILFRKPDYSAPAAPPKRKPAAAPRPIRNTR